MKGLKERFTGKVLIGIGILLVGVAVLVNLLDYHREKELLLSLTQAIPKPVTEQGEEENTALADPEVTEGTEATEVTEVIDSIGIMLISKIDLQVPIQEGIDSRRIRSALGHVPGSALPWDSGGNCAIAGHRNYAFGRFFNRLDEMEIGDAVEITSLEGKQYQYEVEEIVVVEPTDVSVLEPTEEATLTLITCTPIYLATHRLIVKCRLVAVT